MDGENETREQNTHLKSPCVKQSQVSAACAATDPIRRGQGRSLADQAKAKWIHFSSPSTVFTYRSGFGGMTSSSTQLTIWVTTVSNYARIQDIRHRAPDQNPCLQPGKQSCIRLTRGVRVVSKRVYKGVKSPKESLWIRARLWSMPIYRFK